MRINYCVKQVLEMESQEESISFRFVISEIFQLRIKVCMVVSTSSNLTNVFPKYNTFLLARPVCIRTICSCQYSVNTVPYTKSNNKTRPVYIRIIDSCNNL